MANNTRSSKKSAEKAVDFNAPTLVGRYFITTDEEFNMHNQACISADLGGGFYLATMFAWLMGDISGSVVVDIHQLQKHAIFTGNSSEEHSDWIDARRNNTFFRPPFDLHTQGCTKTEASRDELRAKILK